MIYKRYVFSNVLHDSLSIAHTRAYLLITCEQASYSYHNMSIIFGQHKYYDI